MSDEYKTHLARGGDVYVTACKYLWVQSSTWNPWEVTCKHCQKHIKEYVDTEIDYLEGETDRIAKKLKRYRDYRDEINKDA